MAEAKNNYEISIDKISFVCDVPSFVSSTAIVRRYWNSFHSLVSNCEREFIPNSIFENNVKFGGVYVSWGRGLDACGRKMRLEFNPNKVDYESLFKLLPYVGESSFKSSRVTRIDTAIDYMTVLDGNMFYDKFKRKCNYHYGKGHGLETLYLGSGKSDVKFRIYDKAVEQAESFDIDVNHSWWRVEAQDQRGYDFFGWVENPFKSLRYYRRYDCEALKGLEYFFWVFVEQKGLQAGLSYFSDRMTRNRLVSKLVESDEIIQPFQAFENDFHRVWDSFKSRLLSAF